jgi:hypothetical protein
VGWGRDEREEGGGAVGWGWGWGWGRGIKNICGP